MISIQGDTNAEYSDEVEIDVSGLPPQVAAPSSPTNVFSVSELDGTEIHSGFIGSCTNGRLADLKEAARVLKGKKVKEGIMLKIVPATQKVYAELLHEGVLEDLFQSGGIISNPGCAGCAEGHIGLTGKGEVQISTGNRNFAGKQGKGLTYLASPAVVAASCIRGEICNPVDL
jgi:3-isopropylmalate/(R)-2-methylmalate dehydratase large subunit